MSSILDLFKDTEGVIKFLKYTEGFSDIMTLLKNFMSTRTSKEHKENINTIVKKPQIIH